MNPLLVANIANGARKFFSNRNVQIAIVLLILYWVFKKKIAKAIRRYRERKFDKNEGNSINQLAHQYRAAVNRSGIKWMINFDGTSEDEIKALAHQTKGKLQQVADAYKLKFNESLSDRMRKELSASDFQNWWNIVT
ncbi:hypothetical protein ABW636_14140 [Aquimarina sp. 2201CG1-2-11]|uniref:hypothetical protein n=1 Tax=Aquimarina discodermiae TaxID=3231043 RepID=UPI00346238D1